MGTGHELPQSPPPQPQPYHIPVQGLWKVDTRGKQANPSRLPGLRLHNFLRCVMDERDEAETFPDLDCKSFRVAADSVNSLYSAVCKGVRRQHTTCSTFTGRYLTKMADVRRMMQRLTMEASSARRSAPLATSVSLAQESRPRRMGVSK